MRSLAIDLAPAASLFADWRASEKLLATSLYAKFIDKTNSGHKI